MSVVVGTLTRTSDEFYLINTISWSSSNTWQNLFAPSNGESGEIWIDFTDTADSSKRKFQKFGYQKDQTGAVTFATSATVATVVLGSATVFAKLQDASGTIQILHTAGANRTCSLKWRKVVNVA